MAAANTLWHALRVLVTTTPLTFVSPVLVLLLFAHLVCWFVNRVRAARFHQERAARRKELAAILRRARGEDESGMVDEEDSVELPWVATLRGKQADMRSKVGQLVFNLKRKWCVGIMWLARNTCFLKRRASVIVLHAHHIAC